ncbi:MAG: hypothetical protein Q8N60_03350 [Candidatus Diapherotrites archaeon]|nr:hypothetical protein [Candidatus Diapherotrites archaeon]
MSKGTRHQSGGRGLSSRPARFFAGGRFGSPGFPDKKVHFDERAKRLLETMRSGTPALKRAAREELSKLLPKRKEQLDDYKAKLCKGKSKPGDFSREELLNLNWIEIELAKVELRTAFVGGADPKSKEMLDLGKKLSDLTEQRKKM